MNNRQRKEYAFTLGTLSSEAIATVQYGYDAQFKNRLVSYKGETISGYIMGNPSTYRNKAVEWNNANKLALFDGTTMEYNYAGIRTKKSSASKTTSYAILGDKIIAEKEVTSAGTVEKKYFYGLDGITAMQLVNGDFYQFQKNMFGDVIAIYDSTKTLVAKYEYDAWGNCKVLNSNGIEETSSTFIGNVNPFRYRSYYFDVETGLFRTSTRYYDPEIGRFISPDSVDYLDPETINGLNLYAYCGNDPINCFDPTGHSWESFWNGVGDWFSEHWVEVAVGTAFIVGGAIVTALTCGAGTTAWAAFGSALLSSAMQVGASVAVGVGVNGLVNIANGNNFLNNVGDTIASSYMWGGIFSGGSQMLSGGFRALRIKTGYTGISANKVGFMSPDKLYYDKAGMTLVRLGSRNGLKFALDLGRYGIHAHIFSGLHIPIIPIIVGLIEWTN